MRVVLALLVVLAVPASAHATYGHSTRFRALRCRSRRSGITCRSTSSGHGFKVSVAKRRLF